MSNTLPFSADGSQTLNRPGLTMYHQSSQTTWFHTWWVSCGWFRATQCLLRFSPPSFFFTPLPCPNVSPWFKSIDWTGAVVMTKDSWFMWSAVMSSFRDQRVTVIISIKDLLYPVFYRNMTHKLVSKHTVFMKLSMLTEGGNTDGGMKLSTYFPTTSLTWLLTRAR